MKLPISPHTPEHERLIRATATSINALYRPHLAADHQAPNLSEEVEGELTALLRAFSQSSAHQMERLDVTILLSDVRGFTSLFEEVFADEVIWLLNQYFSTMSDIITRHHGRVDKFMGDSIMAVFSMPTGDMQTPLQAVICAAEMQLAMDGLNTSFKQSGLPEVFMGKTFPGQATTGEVHRYDWEAVPN